VIRLRSAIPPPKLRCLLRAAHACQCLCSNARALSLSVCALACGPALLADPFSKQLSASFPLPRRLQSALVLLRLAMLDVHETARPPQEDVFTLDRACNEPRAFRQLDISQLREAPRGAREISCLAAHAVPTNRHDQHSHSWRLGSPVIPALLSIVTWQRS
jgi:hypothetical protein